MNHQNVLGALVSPKGMTLNSKQIIFTSKCRPVLVLRGYAYLMVSTLHVKATKYTIPTQAVYQLINA